MKISDDDLRELYRQTYWEAQNPWMLYIQATSDRTDGLVRDGTPEKDAIADRWEAFFAVSKEWELRHPTPSGKLLGCDPKGYPFVFTPNTTVTFEAEPEK